MFPDVDTRDAAAVASRIREHLRSINPEGSLNLFDEVYHEVGRMFRGEFGDFQPIDLLFHDYQHTLQATLCMAELLAGRHRADSHPPFPWRHIELGMVAILFHDSGYLKTRSDGGGTGAKYTYAHVMRSVAVTASQLPRFGIGPAEIGVVVGAIRCTGPTSNINRLNYTSDLDLLLGCCVATADYLGQMAAADYPDELEILFREFEENDDYLGIPPEKRMFRSADDLQRKTPGFWSHLVRPKLETDFRGVYRYLANPYPTGPNRYVEAVERNIALIEARIAGASSLTA